jgi:hypothetical protein
MFQYRFYSARRLHIEWDYVRKDYPGPYSNYTRCNISLELLFVLRNFTYSVPKINVGWLKVHFLFLETG